MAGIDRVKEQILEKADIAEIVSQYVHLQPKSGRLFGLCPFHKEKTPSFTVNPERGFFHCFGCGKGGNVIDFVMEMETLTYAEARRVLAERLGIPIPKTLGPKRQHEDVDRYQVMELAANFYAKRLQTAPKALEYLHSRGLNKEDIQRFGLGYAPPEWDTLYQALKQRGVPETVQVELGLVIPRKEHAGCLDRFRGRILFPIRNTLGRVIAFGGRTLDPKEPAKYLNSNDTPLFNKSKVLYLLDQAKESVKERGAVLVEGYMDAISLHRHGFKQTVATLGTALTKDHLAILRRYTKSFTLLYDGDEAGIRAAMRGVELFMQSSLAARVVLLPSGLDPDDFVKAQGAEALQELLDSALEGFDFYVRQIVKRHDPATTQGKLEIVEAMLPLLASVKEAFIRADYIRQLALRVGSSVPQLEASVQKKLAASTPAAPPAAKTTVTMVKTNQPADPMAAVKETLVRLLAYHHGLITPEDQRSRPRIDLFTREQLTAWLPAQLRELNEQSAVDRILEKILLCQDNAPAASPAARMEMLFPELEERRRFIAILEAEPLPRTEDDLRRMHQRLMQEIQQEIIQRQQQKIIQNGGQNPLQALQAVNELLLSSRREKDPGLIRGESDEKEP